MHGNKGAFPVTRIVIADRQSEDSRPTPQLVIVLLPPSSLLFLTPYHSGVIDIIVTCLGTGTTP